MIFIEYHQKIPKMIKVCECCNVEFTTICDPETGAVIATSKNPTNIYKYYYNLYIIEEKYNILFFQNGFGGLLYSR